MIYSASTLNNPNRIYKFFLIIAALIFCLSILDRNQILNHFTIFPGDRYDAVIVAVIHEHWFRVLRGLSSWTDASYFYPHTKTIAQTDAYFLTGLLYSPFRVFGLDPFTATFLSGVLLRAIGFMGCYFCCRKVFSMSFYWALLAAILFTLTNTMSIHSQRLQLATIALIPVMLLLLSAMFKSFFTEKIRKFVLFGSMAGILFGTWCLSCFYIAWFFLYFFTFFMLVFSIKNRDILSSVKNLFIKHKAAVFLVMTVALLSLTPFMYAFIGKSQEVGVRPYEAALSNTIPLENILQVGHENYLWGHTYKKILQIVSPSYDVSSEYDCVGFAIILFICFVLGCIYFLRKSDQQPINRVMKSIAITSLLTWLFTLKFMGHSGWFFMYHFFPGAKALNVIAVYQVFLVFPVVLISMKYLSMKRIGLPLFLILSAILITEEFSKQGYSLDRRVEMSRIALSQLPPKNCRAFYVSGWQAQGAIPVFKENINNVYAHSVTAMLIAQLVGIPTINGFASFMIPDSNLSSPNQPDYEARVFAYAKKHNVTGLCKLDLNTKAWSVVIN